MRAILITMTLIFATETLAYGFYPAPPPAPVTCYTVKTATGWTTVCR